MKAEIEILVVDDDKGHSSLIKRNLSRSGLTNPIRCFEDGRSVLDFLFRKGDGPHRESNVGYLMLLDINMPGMDGVEVLTKVKEDKELRKIPVVMLTTTDDPIEIDHCHAIGCNSYITKPLDPTEFMNAIRQLGLFFAVVKVPEINDN